MYIYVHAYITDIVNRCFSVYFRFINDMQESSLFLYIYHVTTQFTGLRVSNGFSSYEIYYCIFGQNENCGS